MIAKNTGPKILGFGAASLLPGETAALPKGYGSGHTTVRFYLEKGWLEEAPDGPLEEAPDGPQEQAAGAAAGADGAENEVKALKGMTLDALKAKAGELGIEFGDKDTKAALADKITAKLAGG